MIAPAATERFQPPLLCIVFVAAAVGTLSLCSQHATALEVDVRAKLFAAGAVLPEHDFQRQELDSPTLDGSADLRLMFKGQNGHLSYSLHHTTLLLSGDSLLDANTGVLGFDQVALDDSARALDLSWELDEGTRHRLVSRVDRATLTFQNQKSSLTVGRDALSWGNGKVFNPMDLFSPFAPTTLDRDFKPGDDLIRVDHLLKGGDDLQAVAVLRRDEEGQRSSRAASFGIKWHRLLEDSELELVLGRHRDENMAAVSYRMPIGGAMLSTDWVATDSMTDGSPKLSGIVNIDYSLVWAERTAYVFAEYYRNGFGVSDEPLVLTELPTSLVERLGAGEVFGLMKHYFSVGINYQWHPLVNQSVIGIVNLHDSSSLWQTSISFDPSDNQRIDFGLTLTTGGRGDEYGALDLPSLDVENVRTTGGGDRIFLRWVYYW